MRRIVLLAGCVIALGAMGELAGAAFAEPPEFGTCVQVAPKTGAYSGRSCLHPAKPGKGKYEWMTEPTANNKFSGFLEEPVLKTTGAQKIQVACVFGELEGEYTGAKSLIIKQLLFGNCQRAGVSNVLESWCQNVASFRGEVSTQELTGELGYIEHGAKTRVGLDIKPKAGKALALFECGGASPVGEYGTGTGTLLEVEGSVIGRVKRINKPVEENVTTFMVKNGMQIPEQFEGGLKDTLTTLVGVTKTAEPSTLSGYAEVESQEEVEIKAK